MTVNQPTPQSSLLGAEATSDSPPGPAPRVSVGLPVFNGEPYLEHCLAGIEAQRFRDFELVISDNASQDRTPEICRALAGRDPRARYVRNPENIGIAENFEAVARLARGELFVWAASDDRWEPEFLDALVGALDGNPAVDLAYAGYDWIDNTGKWRRPGSRRAAPWMPAFAAPYLSFGAQNHLIRRVCLHWWWRNSYLIYGLFRRAALLSTMPFEYPCAWARHVDTLMMLKFLCQHDVAFVDRVLWHYRIKERELAELASYYSPGARPEAMPAETTPAAEERELLGRALRIVGESALLPSERRILRLALPALSWARRARNWNQERRGRRP